MRNLALTEAPDTQEHDAHMSTWWVARLECTFSLESFNLGGRSGFFQLLGSQGRSYVPRWETFWGAPKFTTSQHRSRSDACILDYIALDFRSESANRIENASHRKGDFLQRTSHCTNRLFLDERQIIHLLCARLRYDLYDFFRGCFWAFIQDKEREQAQNTP